MTYLGFLPAATTDGRSAIARIHAAHPGMIRRFYDAYLELMVRPGPLSAAQRELIATVASAENGCLY